MTMSICYAFVYSRYVDAVFFMMPRVADVDAVRTPLILMMSPRAAYFFYVDDDIAVLSPAGADAMILMILFLA